MRIQCQLRDPDIDADDLLKLTRDFRAVLVDETDAEAELAVGADGAGTRGDPITLGVIAVTFLTSGAAVALIKVLETYIGRRPSLEVELSRADGGKLSIKAQDLNSKSLSQTQQTLEKFIKP
jgi:hypothetical protein